MLRKTSGLVEVVANALLPLENKIAVALVFGSIASGTENEGSDIDLLIIGDVDFNEVITALFKKTLNVLKLQKNIFQM
jgi:predicted nucleotidyltransferase